MYLLIMVNYHSNTVNNVCVSVSLEKKNTTIQQQCGIIDVYTGGEAGTYSKTPIYRGQFFPQIGLDMHIVNEQNPDLPRTPIYRGCSISPNPAVNQGFTIFGMTRDCLV